MPDIVGSGVVFPEEPSFRGREEGIFAWSKLNSRTSIDRDHALWGDGVRLGFAIFPDDSPGTSHLGERR